MLFENKNLEDKFVKWTEHILNTILLYYLYKNPIQYKMYSYYAVIVNIL